MFGVFRGLGKPMSETVMRTPMLDFMIVGSSAAFLALGVKIGLGVSDDYMRTESTFARRYLPKYAAAKHE